MVSLAAPGPPLSAVGGGLFGWAFAGCVPRPLEVMGRIALPGENVKEKKE